MNNKNNKKSTENNLSKIKKEIIRIDGRLKEIITVHNEKGDILHKIINPLMVELSSRDIMQLIVGSTLLAIPVAFTEETWNLGELLPISRVFALMAISLIFVSSFVYYNYYNGRFVQHKTEFIKRVLSTYVIAFIVVGLFLTIIQKTPWSTDWILAFKRTVIVAFPASMSAAVADMIK